MFGEQAASRLIPIVGCDLAGIVRFACVQTANEIEAAVRVQGPWVRLHGEWSRCIDFGGRCARESRHQGRQRGCLWSRWHEIQVATGVIGFGIAPCVIHSDGPIAQPQVLSAIDAVVGGVLHAVSYADSASASGAVDVDVRSNNGAGGSVRRRAPVEVHIGPGEVGAVAHADLPNGGDVATDYLTQRARRSYCSRALCV